MLTRLVMIDGIEHTVTTPIVNSVISDLNKYIIKDEDSFVYKQDQYDNENASYTDHNYDDSIGGSNIEVTYTLSQNEDFRLTTSTYKPINRVMLRDVESNIVVRPIYISTDLEITVTYVGQSKSKLSRIINRFNTYFMTSGYTIPHNLPYSFLLPESLISLLKDIGTIKGYGNVSDYVNDIAEDVMDTAIKKGTEYKVPAFRGTQANMVGRIMTSPSDMEISKGSGSEYTLEFKHMINYQQPTALSVKYPVQIRNVKLDDKWIPNSQVGIPTKKAYNSLDVLNIIRTHYASDNSNRDIIYSIPTYDEFKPELYNTLYMRLFSILLEVDPANKNLIFNIGDLRHIGIPDNIVEHLLKYKDSELTIFGSSVFLFHLYENYYIKDKKMYLTDDKTLVTTEELDITKTYRILISVLDDMEYIRYNGSSTLVDDQRLLQELGIPYRVDKRKMLLRTCEVNGS